jgi:hypothetical protein
MAEQALPIDVGDEPLIGWRCWHVLPHEGLLRPIYKRGLVWKPRQTLEALCPEDPHEPPDEHCRCGVWTVCHPMLLDEVGWTKAPPIGTAPLPGIMVVGEVSLWGKIIQHERGWRASCAYPRHLYVFTEDAMLAETLRERYGVPVEWGADTERLRRILPQKASKDDAPALRETLLDVLRAGLCPKPLEELAAKALDEWGDLRHTPEQRIEAARARLAKETGKERAESRWHLATAAADLRALEGDTTAGRRALWVRLARWQRNRSVELFEKKIERRLKERDGLLEDLARGTIAKGRRNAGHAYTPAAIARKRARLEDLDRDITTAIVPEIEALQAVPIPSYREWCAIAQGLAGGPSRRPLAKAGEAERAWVRRALQREQDLAALDRELALRRHQLNVDVEALARERAQLHVDRKALRDSVVAGVQRDHAELLREVADLEARRRAALAMLPGPWPPPDPRPITARAQRSTAEGTIAARLHARGITQQRVAEAANVSRSLVSHVLAGRAQSRNVVEAAERLLSQQQ